MKIFSRYDEDIGLLQIYSKPLMAVIYAKPVMIQSAIYESYKQTKFCS